MPNVVALMNEYAPKKSRSTLVAIMFSGYSLGGMLSAGLGMLFIPQWGWQAVFYVALIPLLILPLLLRQLPESMDFLLRSGQIERAKSLLTQTNPSYMPQADDQLVHAVSRGSTASIGELFRDGRSISTFALWVAFFCCLLMVYALSSWLPKIMSSAGYGLNSSLAFLLVLNGGAIVGAIAGGWLGDRVGITRVLLLFFVCGALSLSLLAITVPLAVLYLLIAIAGACTIGTQILANACAVQFYPPHVRSTGLGNGSRPYRRNYRPGIGGCIAWVKLTAARQFSCFCHPRRRGGSCDSGVLEALQSSPTRANQHADRFLMDDEQYSWLWWRLWV